MKRFDFTVFLGLAIGLAAILAAALFEGLSLKFLWHSTAALVVGGGTLGAVIVRRGFGSVTGAIKAVWHLQRREETDGGGGENHKVELARLAWVAQSARRKGVRVFEDYADASGDALVAQGFLLLAEGAPAEQVKGKLDRRLDWENEQGLQAAATLEAAAGFAPTFGILGAVLGLISVLRVIDQPNALGAGIATAFVATIYGIGAANLFLFPLASRLRARHENHIRRREDIAAVIIALAAGETPRAIANRFDLKVSLNG